VAAYRYEALDMRGQVQRGMIEADSSRAARTQLRNQGLTPLRVESAGQPTREARFGRLFLGSKLSNRERASLTRQIASLLIAGLPLDEVLGILSEQATRDYVRDLLASIRTELIGGRSLANILESHTRDFPSIYRGLVAAGEHTGKLGLVLSRLADYIEQRNALEQKIQVAFAYPAVVSLVAVGIISFLLSYVVPQVVNVFVSTKQQLPFLTSLTLVASGFVRHWGFALLVGLALGAWVVRRILGLTGPRLVFDRWILNTPQLGTLLRGYNTVRFASTLAILTAAGVPILRALQAAGDTLNNRAMRRVIDEAIGRVREGTALSRALAGTRIFPPVLVHLIRSGEATGDVTGMLDRAATAEAMELERRTLFLTTLLEPLLILVMGGMVLTIVLAVMLPIIDLNQMVQ